MQKCTKRLCCTAWCITTSNQLIQYTVCIGSSSSELNDVYGQHQHVTACLQCTKSTAPFPPSTQRCMSHSTGQLTAAQHSTAQHSTAQLSPAQPSPAQHSTAQHSTAQHSTAAFNFSANSSMVRTVPWRLVHVQVSDVADCLPVNLQSEVMTHKCTDAAALYLIKPFISF